MGVMAKKKCDIKHLGVGGRSLFNRAGDFAERKQHLDEDGEAVAGAVLGGAFNDDTQPLVNLTNDIFHSTKKSFFVS